ncbi:biotin-dependent carboxyltransferase family protein [Methylococcus sp. EFPC2]|nr:biotin-dependent carboxyltransferase family protein [Methylococcus sp. EFPC2]
MIRVEKAGLFSTVQDSGRPGWQYWGITVGGVMDSYSAAVANLLVGNTRDAAMLEITLQGPRLHFESGTWLAITGGDLSPELDGKPLPGWRPIWAPAGSRLSFGRPRLGCRAYLAVAGGISLPRVLGSRSTHTRAGFGGLEGRPLQEGDRLAFGASALPIPRDPHRPLVPNWYVNANAALPLEAPARLRLIPAPDWTNLPRAGQRSLNSEAYRIGSLSDRMGLRLEGPPLPLPTSGERLSAGVTYGTLQLPPGGQPIILGVDRQTTGGYPVLGTVASVDQARLAQLKPGDPVSFEAISVERAQALYRARSHGLRRLQASLSLRWPRVGLI